MEESNVNRLNGIPNFGHGIEVEESVEVQEESVEDAPRKKGKKGE